MNREQTIQIAKKVGFFDEEIDKYELLLESFAKLVAEHEREACAKLADEIDPVWESLSVAIRARRQV